MQQKTPRPAVDRKLLLVLLTVLLWGPAAIGVAAHIWGIVLIGRETGTDMLVNSPSNAARIEVPQLGIPWKFAVIGDLGKRYEIFLRALAEMKKNDVRFVFIAGDLAYRKTPEQFEYLKLKIAQSGFGRPIFAAIGNEDAVGRHDYSFFRRNLAAPSEAGRSASPGFFSYGGGFVERFAFTVPINPPRQALFVAFDNAFGTPSDEQIAWMEKVLTQSSGQVKNVFLVGHGPIVRTFRAMQKVPAKEYLRPYERVEEPVSAGQAPKLVYELIGIDPNTKNVPLLALPPESDASVRLENGASSLLWKDYRRFYDILRKFKVTAVFSGHLHGYGRYRIAGTDHFISGGGGARLQYGGAHHHYLEVEVKDDRIDVRPRLLDSKISLMTTVEQIMIAEIFLYCRNNPWLYGAAVVWILGGVWLMRFYKKTTSFQ